MAIVEPAVAPGRRVLGPAQRPAAPFPRYLWWIAAAAGACMLAAQALGAGDLSPLHGAGFGLALLFGAIAAMWAEQRVFRRTGARGRLARILLALAVPLPVALGALLAIAVLEPLLGAMFMTGLASAALLAFALCYLGASLGSLVVRLVDEFASALFKTFRARTVVGITTLLMIVVGLIGWLALATVNARWQVELGTRADGAINPEELQAAARWLVDKATGTESDRLQLVFAVALVTGLPTLLSALSKIADAITHHVVPLALATKALAAGDRDVRLEESGSLEFRDVARQFNNMVEALGFSERMERAFGAYVSGPVLDRIRTQHGEALIAAARRDATVFFADLRGFTAISERLEPETLLAVLNRFFDRVVDIVAEHEGYLDNFLGDAVLVVFNGPIDQPDHAQRAVRCARAILSALAEMNAAGAFPEVGELTLGVGVATGPLVAGNVGGATRTRYTVIGDTVNLAARLCSAAPAGSVWINRACRDAAGDSARSHSLPPLTVKGKADPVEVFEAGA